MDVSEAIQKRVTIRRWKPTPVEKEKIVKVLEAGRRAPSWGNVQPWRYIVVQDKARIEELAKVAGGQPHLQYCSGCYRLLWFHGGLFSEDA